MFFSEILQFFCIARTLTVLQVGLYYERRCWG